MAGPASARLSPPVVIAAIVVVVVIVGFIGWKTLGGGGPDRVPIDVEKVKASIQQNGFGHK